MKQFFKFFLLGILFSYNLKANDLGPWVFFDLGNTVINSRELTKFKYISGVPEYFSELKRAGFKIGLISNIPESFGLDYDEKLQSLKSYVQNNWLEERPFDWSSFDDVILPLNNSELKPSPILFLKALDKAKRCPSVYFGESIQEIETAAKVGMATKLFAESDTDLFIPLANLRRYIQNNYKQDYDKNCL